MLFFQEKKGKTTTILQSSLKYKSRFLRVVSVRGVQVTPTLNGGYYHLIMITNLPTLISIEPPAVRAIDLGDLKS
jgi:hypothetical protein